MIELQECKKCGSTVMTGYRFCKSCGTLIDVEEVKSAPHHAVNHEVEVITSSSEPKLDQAATKQVENMSIKSTDNLIPSIVSESSPVFRKGKLRTRMIWALSLLLFVVLLIGGYQIGSYWTSDGRLISQFEKSIQSQDYKAVASMFTSDEEKLVINEQTVKDYVDYLKGNKDLVSDVIKDLRKQAFALKSGGETDSNIIHEVMLQQEGKTALIFKEYKLRIIPVHINITTNYKDTIIRINGEEVAVTDKASFDQTFGPYFPGTFELETVLRTDWIDLERKEMATVMSGWQDYIANMELDGTEVTINTGYYDVSTLKGDLLVNGTSTGLNPYEKQTFGPVPTDGTVKLSIDTELPWGKMRTEEVPVESSVVLINIGDVQDTALENEMIEQIVQFNRDEVEALATGNLALLGSVTDRILSYEQTIVDQNRQSTTPHRVTYLSSTFDLDSFVIYQIDGVWQVRVLTTGKYNYEYKEGGEWGVGVENSQGRYFTLIYDEKRKHWLMDAVDIFYDGGEFSDNLKEFVEQKAVAHEAAVQSTSKQADLPSLETFIHDYLTSYVNAINSRDFSLVSVLLDTTGPAYKESEKYISYLEKKGITEEILNVEGVSFRVLDETSVEVRTNETFNIIDKDGNLKEKSYVSTYKLVSHNGNWKVHTLIETKEI
ncbi:hypothetical protein [Paenibacillus sp. PK1-4R]|uniref:zinc ribbon domain-containing protein n=1 Tax=Paenibacillus sp. PK1-4R TaxID=3049075 RepID=UPI0025A23CC6|nr:hypothetical protein [Paenibacillus sp. PK1-4R]WJM08362.1 hypothetical protein QNO02_29935 [Paenibacillus sp. PK1-4R]